MADTEISADTDTEISAETDTETDNFRSLIVIQRGTKLEESYTRLGCHQIQCLIGFVRHHAH